MSMTYKSPIDVIVSQMNATLENEIYKAVQNVGVSVDKDELIKALEYDRNQYQKGYSDMDSEIVRCKECKHGEKPPTFLYYPNLTWCNKYERSHDDDWFCADGERKEGR